MSVALALGAALVFGTGDFLGGLAARRAALLSVLALSQAVGLAGMLAVALVTGGSPSPGDLGAGAVAGIAGGVGVALLYRGLASGAMTLVAPITGVAAALVPVAAGLAFGERPAPLQLAGIGLAIVAVALLSGGPPSRGGRLRRGPLLAALGAGVAFGVFYIALARASGGAGLWPLVAARGASVSMFLLTAAVGRRALSWGRAGPALVAGAGVFDVSANALFLLAVHRGLLSIVAVLVSLYPAATVLCSLAFLGERLRPLQAVGVLVALAAVVLITAG